MRKHVYQHSSAVELYQETHYFPNEVKSKIAQTILARLNLQENPKILYAGSGDGSCFLFPLIESFFNLPVTGTQTSITIVCLDNSDRMSEMLIEGLTKRFDATPVGDGAFEIQRDSKIARVELRKTDVEDPSAPLENDFAMLLCPFLLHHLINWRLILARLLRCLIPGGIVVLAERLGDVAYMDGNFSEFKRDPSNTLEEIFLKFNAYRNEVSVWLPEIKASDYSPVVEALMSRGAEIEKFPFRWRHKASLYNWVSKKVYTNFWLGLKPEKLQSALSNANIPSEEKEFNDGLKLIIARIPNPQSISKHILSSFPRTVLSKLWQPTLYATEDFKRLYLEALRTLYLCATHDVFNGMTQWAFAVYWSPATHRWQPQMPLMLFDYNPLEREEIHRRLFKLLRYFQTIKQLGIAFIDLVFLSLRQKPIIIVRSKRDLSEVKVNYRWDSSIDLRGFPRCLYLFIDLPVRSNKDNQNDKTELDKMELFGGRLERFIHQLRSNWYVIQWDKIMDEYLSQVNPYTYSQNGTSIELSKELVVTGKEQETQRILGQICEVLRQLMTDSLTHIVYVPSEFLYTDSEKSSAGYGGIIFGENLELTTKLGFTKEDLEENLRERAKWCRLIVDRILGQIGLLEHRRVMFKHALRSAIAAIMGRNTSHNLGSHGLAHLIGGTISVRPEEQKEEQKEKEEQKRFLEYLKARMDFVAEVTTYWGEMAWLERLTL